MPLRRIAGMGGKRQDLIAFAAIGTVIAGVMLSARPIAQPEMGAPPSSSSPNASVAPVPTSNAGPDLGSLQEDIGSVLVVSWQGTEISPSLRSLLGLRWRDHLRLRRFVHCRAVMGA